MKNMFSFLPWAVDKTSDRFFVAVFTMLGKMAAADGRISEEEEELIGRFIGEYLVMTKQEEARAIKIFREAYNDGSDFSTTAKTFYSTFKRHPIMQDMIFDMLLQLSIADGEISPEEDILLRIAARQFNFDKNRYDHLRSLHLAGGTKVVEQTYYHRLECSPESSNEEIIKQYRHLTTLYDLDAVLEAGIPEIFINVAGKKLDDIEEAFSFIKLYRGIEDQDVATQGH